MVATHDAMRRDETGRGPVPLVPTFSVGCLDVHIGVPLWGIEIVEQLCSY